MTASATLSRASAVDTPWLAHSHASLAVGLIALLALALRLPGLNESIWFDELLATRISLGTPQRLVTTIRYDLHPPLYTLLMYVWIRVFGDSELAVRMVPLLFGIGSIPLAFVVARRLIGQPAALLAVLLLAVSPPHIWYSQEARAYSLTVFLALLCAYAFHRAIDQPDSRRRFWVLVLVLFLAAMTHFYSIAFCGIVAVLAIVYRYPQWRALLIAVVGIIVAEFGLIALKFAAGSTVTSGSYLRTLNTLETWKLALNWMLNGDALWQIEDRGSLFRSVIAEPLMLTVQLGLLGILLNGAVRLYRADRYRALELLSFMLAVPLVLITLTVIGRGGTYIERSALATLPFLLMLLAYGALAFGRLLRLLTTSAVIAFAIVALVAFYQKRNIEWTVHKPNADWRSASRYLRAHGAESTGGVMVLTAAYATELLYYDSSFRQYRDDEPPPVTTPASGMKGAIKRWLSAVPTTPGRNNVYVITQRQRETVEQLMTRRGDARVFLVRNAYWFENYDSLAAGVRAAGLRPLAEYQRDGIQIVELGPVLVSATQP